MILYCTDFDSAPVFGALFFVFIKEIFKKQHNNKNNHNSAIDFIICIK